MRTSAGILSRPLRFRGARAATKCRLPPSNKRCKIVLRCVPVQICFGDFEICGEGRRFRSGAQSPAACGVRYFWSIHSPHHAAASVRGHSELAVLCASSPSRTMTTCGGIASAFAHSGHVFVLLPIQAFSALSIEWSGYEGFHRGFSLGSGAKSEAIEAAQSGRRVKGRGTLRLVSSRKARIEQRKQHEKNGVGETAISPKIGDAKARQR